MIMRLPRWTDPRKVVLWDIVAEEASGNKEGNSWPARMC